MVYTPIALEFALMTRCNRQDPRQQAALQAGVAGGRRYPQDRPDVAGGPHRQTRPPDLAAPHRSRDGPGHRLSVQCEGEWQVPAGLGRQFVARYTTTPLTSSAQTQKDLPIQFLSVADPLDARLLIGSFGSSRAYNGVAFQLSIDRNPDVPVPTAEVLRYGKLPEIHHVFKGDPKSPPIVVTLAFVGIVLAALPVLAGLVCMRYLDCFHRLTCRSAVALPRRQCQPPPDGIEVGPSSPCRVRRVVDRDRGVFLPLLHLLEPFPAPPGRGCSGNGCICQWQPRVGRSTEPAVCWSAIRYGCSDKRLQRLDVILLTYL